MATMDVLLPSVSTGEMPVVKKIGIDDLKDALKKGWDDFRAMPTHVIFIGLIYPILGILLGRLAMGYNVLPLLYPLAGGFAIMGPIAAIGLYELSRRREAGMDTSWRHAFDVFYSPSLKGILALGALLLALFVVWIAIAQTLYVSNFGYAEPVSWTGFLGQIFTTEAGRNLLVFGNLIGFLFALAALILSAVSFPLLLDRDVGPVAAMLTSIRAFTENPVTMAVWGLIVAAGLAIGFATAMLGLAVIVPVLGHATWHLYRKVVKPDGMPHPLYNRVQKGYRFGADFPANLFSRYPNKDEK